VTFSCFQGSKAKVAQGKTVKNLSTLACKFHMFKSSNVNLFFIAMLTLVSCFSVNAKTLTDDSDGDGLSDQFEETIGTEAYLSDTDGDGIKDGVEVGENLNKPLDSDGDGRIDALDYDDDNDGLPSFLESKIDTDKDGIKDYLDKDSDNDGVADGTESGVLNKDKNLDGIDDAFDTQRTGAIDENGDGIDDNLKLPDYNHDGIADYLDANYKNNNVDKTNLAINTGKKIIKNQKKSHGKKVNEPKLSAPQVTAKDKTTEKVILNRYTDSDNDGLLDSQEIILGTNPLKRDSDGDKVSDAIEIGMDINNPQDSDHDNIIDALDPDDDNDGILSKDEDINKDSTAINDDTDEDGVPNYLDANDDGDNKLTRDEGGTKDSDGDGILDYLDKNDGAKDNAPAIFNQDIEPEVVVLFDGDASALMNDELIESGESIQLIGESTTELIVSKMLEHADLDSSNPDNSSVENKQLEKSAAENRPKKIDTAKFNKANSATSHWNLF